ncbi:dephospho-CoA kinase, partial [Fimicolochytrium jonesii]|uniref:dephospho-CoA kinase n=1 Tax=Fimicolochytrium jonesii TaxID=1396493 RepID=UPI0022FE79DC
MLLIGLTGGIATGKSTASQHLANSAPPIPIIDADLIARQVVAPHRPAYYSLVRHFGLQIINPETLEIDRAKLGAIVFSGEDVDGRQRKVLNGITHPDIRAEMLHCALKCFLRGERMCVLDTPLLFEAGLWKVVNVVMVVYCSEQAQLARLTARDSLTPTDAKSRIASQMPIDEKRQRADILIDNSSATPDDMRTQLDAAVTKLRPGR